MKHPLIQRYLHSAVKDDALQDQKIAFISGPRQVGKTSFAKALLQEILRGGDPRKDQVKSPREMNAGYFSWDDDEFRLLWNRGAKVLFERNHVLVLDEIHKDRNWKRRLKGLYDFYGDHVKIIVTGSARLDFFRRSGESLQGRYLPYRLHPLTLNECGTIPPPPEDQWEGETRTRYELNDLLELGGFPDPFFGQSASKAARWRRLYRERMIREDLRDLSEVRDLERIKTLAILLETGSAATLSYESLRQDLQISFDTVRHWIGLLEAVYFSFRVRPFFKGIRNSLRKEPKVFLTDWSAVKDEGARFENLIACHLLKSCHAWTDSAIGEFELHYVRDKQKREVDFLVTRDGSPWLLVEAKSGDSQPTPALVHYNAALKPKFAIQVVRRLNQERRPLASPGIQVIEARRFLSRLV